MSWRGLVSQEPRVLLLDYAFKWSAILPLTIWILNLVHFFAKWWLIPMPPMWSFIPPNMAHVGKDSLAVIAPLEDGKVS